MRNKIFIGIGVVLMLIILFLLSKKGSLSALNPSTHTVSTEGMFIPDLNLPRGVRNNNPGNLRIGPSNWQGKVPIQFNSDGEFEQFWEYSFGVRAMIVLLTNYMNDGDNTIVAIILRWAPPSENNSNAYITNLAEFTGFDEYEELSPTKETLRGLVKGIAKSENGFECVTNSEFNQGYSLV